MNYKLKFVYIANSLRMSASKCQFFSFTFLEYCFDWRIIHKVDLYLKKKKNVSCVRGTFLIIKVSDTILCEDLNKKNERKNLNKTNKASKVMRLHYVDYRRLLVLQFFNFILFFIRKR